MLSYFFTYAAMLLICFCFVIAESFGCLRLEGEQKGMTRILNPILRNQAHPGTSPPIVPP